MYVTIKGIDDKIKEFITCYKYLENENNFQLIDSWDEIRSEEYTMDKQEQILRKNKLIMKSYIRIVLEFVKQLEDKLKENFINTSIDITINIIRYNTKFTIDKIIILFSKLSQEISLNYDMVKDIIERNKSINDFIK